MARVRSAESNIKISIKSSSWKRTGNFAPWGPPALKKAWKQPRPTNAEEDRCWGMSYKKLEATSPGLSYMPFPDHEHKLTSRMPPPSLHFY